MKIVTITLNPAVDKSTSVDHVVSDKKLRCEKPIYEPGGGGINVSRALNNLGEKSLAIYMAGGSGGDMLQKLLDLEQVPQRPLAIKNSVRINLSVFDNTTHELYRFGMPGPELHEDEYKKVIPVLDKLEHKPEFLVASGSLPPGVPDDYYAQLAEYCKHKDIKFVVDTSGKALNKAVEAGVYMIKPNVGEISKMVGKESLFANDLEEVALDMISSGKVKVLAISLGAQGALLACNNELEYVMPPTVEAKSVVGAGDSMVAGMIYSLSRGGDIREVIRYGVAAGTAATMSPGTKLCEKEDVEKLYKWLNRRK